MVDIPKLLRGFIDQLMTLGAPFPCFKPLKPQNRIAIIHIITYDYGAPHCMRKICIPSLKQVEMWDQRTLPRLELLPRGWWLVWIGFGFQNHKQTDRQTYRQTYIHTCNHTYNFNYTFNYTYNYTYNHTYTYTHIYIDRQMFANMMVSRFLHPTINESIGTLLFCLDVSQLGPKPFWRDPMY